MSPRTVEQNEAIRKEKRQQIIDAALEVFSYNGYYSSSMSKIAKQAGISKGLTYSYFESKEELLRAVITDGFAQLSISSSLFPDGIHSKENMIAVLDFYIDAIENNTRYWKLYFSLLFQANLSEIFTPEMQEVMQNYLQQVAAYFEKKGVEDPMSEAMFFGAMLDGIFSNYLINPEVIDIEKMKQTIIKKFL